MNYQLYFSNKRKTIALQIKQGDIVVRAPSYLSEEQVEKFVFSKKNWIEKKLSSNQVNNGDSFTFQNGDSLLIFGHKRTFSFNYGFKKGVYLQDDSLLITLSEREFRASNRGKYLRIILLEWLKMQVNKHLEHALADYQSLMGVKASAVKVRLYKSRWGSCNNKQELTFNTLLAMVPKEVMNYVIVHELAHITHMNHSAAFWQHVANYSPNFQNLKEWLKKNQKNLSLPN